jgi:type VI secretion system protein ImpB
MSIQDQLPKSRITLTYRTTINGEQETVNLPLRLLMLGDFSLGSSEDRKVDLEARKLRSVNGKNLDELMKDMKMSVAFQVPNRINPDVEADLNVELPIDRMKSFHPDEIVNHVPKLKALRLLKKLLLEMQSSIDNQKALRSMVYELFSNKDALKAVLAELKDYESLRLPGKPALASDATPAPATQLATVFEPAIVKA